MSFEFTDDILEKIKKLKERYPSPKALTLPLLWIAQEQEGFISMEAMEVIAEHTTRPTMEIYKTATFYTMFNLTPVGTYHIQLCKTLSCSLSGKDDILQHIKKSIGIEVGETTEDGKFTLSQVECLGSCGTAPIMQINTTNHESLTVEKIDEILEELK